MIKYDFKQYCTGCGGCKDVCPVNAIKLVEDKTGLKLPSIDKEKCINCGKCENVCPHLNARKYNKEINTFTPKTWLYSSQNNEAKLRSTSGGAFYELAKKIIDDGGYVCGCIWDDGLDAKHIVSNSINDIEKMQGSKYVQSDIGDCYKKVLDLITSRKKVLFSGTPCQCVAMKLYMQSVNKQKLKEKLITVAVICHGIAYPKVWKSYKEWIENKYGEKLTDVHFRDKTKKGYKKSYCKLTFESGKKVFFPTYLPGSKYIESTIVYNLGLRNSCANCDCKGINQACDIILGDWYAAYKGNGKLGTSCIISYTEQGEKVVEKYLDNLNIFNFQNVLQDNKYILKSIKTNKNNDKFLENLNNIKMWDNVEKFYPSKYKYKKISLKLGIYDILKKIIK